MTETTKQALKDAMLLCQWIAESPHQRGSINGLAAQVQYAASAAPASSTQPSAVQPDPHGIAIRYHLPAVEQAMTLLDELGYNYDFSGDGLRWIAPAQPSAVEPTAQPAKAKPAPASGGFNDMDDGIPF